MQVSDRLSGIGLMALGAAAIAGAAWLPPMRGQSIGPSVFPSVIGAGLVICGGLIAFGIGRSFEEEAAKDVAAHSNVVADAEPDRFSGLRAFIPVIAVLFYVVAVEPLGFVPVAALIVGSVALALSSGWKLALGLAIIAPPIIHALFAKLLRVPLPSGLLPMPW
jgi:putative tricarboxylic transport membrane protein